MPTYPAVSEALKHAIYARRFGPSEKQALRRMDPLDLNGELALLRVEVYRFAIDIDIEHDPSVRARLLSALTRTVVAIASVARAQALLSKRGSSLEDDIAKALEEVDIYLTDED